MTTKGEKRRDSNIELLRILATFGILFSHATQYMGGGYWWEYFNNPASLSLVVITVFGIWGQVSVAVFIIISAYFVCDSKRVNYSSIVELYIQTVVLNMTVRTFNIVVSAKISISMILKECCKAILSPISGEYWFITGFIIMMATVPILRLFVKNSSKVLLRNTCFLLGGILCVFDIIYYRFAGAVFDFITLFLIISYIKKYYNTYLDKKAKKLMLILGGCFVITVVSINLIGSMMNIEAFNKAITHLFVNWNVIIIFTAISIFWTFKNIKINNNKFINWFAKCSLGIYLLSENSITVNSFLWKNLIGTFDGRSELMFLVKFFFSVICVYCICTLIESVRSIIFNNVIYRNGKIIKAMSWFNALLADR